MTSCIQLQLYFIIFRYFIEGYSDWHYLIILSKLQHPSLFKIIKPQ